MDAVRPDPEEPLLLLSGRSRDLATGPGGEAAVVAGASLEVEVDDTPDGPMVGSVETVPAVDGLAALPGTRAGGGFRRAVAVKTAAEPGSGEHLLLDDVPVCSLISFYAVLHASARETGRNPVPIGDDPRDPGGHPADVCAGFITGGVIMRAMDEDQRAIAIGPAAPSVLGDDELAWHQLPPLPAGADHMRRWRRTDVWLDGEGNWAVDNFYRDSHTTPDGVETVLHEYGISAAIDPASTTVLRCEAEPRVLPFAECLPAALSATRVTGLELAKLRNSVRRTLSGPSSCTHLNDQLRGLADVETLVAHL